MFGDALRRLAAAATYLYQDGSRYWYATQPTVTKLAEDRAEQLKRASQCRFGGMIALNRVGHPFAHRQSSVRNECPIGLICIIPSQVTDLYHQESQR